MSDDPAEERTPAASSGPLAGIVVVEAATFMSGPFAGLQLADLGATVIKVEPPGGDPFRHFGRPNTYVAPHWASVNRGKRSVVLDLKDDQDRDRLLGLVRSADVFLANWRPGVDRALRLSDDVLVEANPQLIRVTITGFGPHGPSAGEPAFDTAVQARSALMDAVAPNEMPIVVPGYPVDKMTALLATQAILAALFARERTGRGDRVELAMLDVAASIDFPDLFPARVFIEHQPDDPHNRHSMALRPLRASDGYLMIAPGKSRQIAAACAAVDHQEWAAEVLAKKNHVQLVDDFYRRLNTVSPAWSVHQLLERFRAAGVPCAPCVRMDEHFSDDQVLHNEIYKIVNWTGVGDARVVRYPAVFGNWPHLLAASPPPVLGAHNSIVEGPPASADTTRPR